MPQTGNQRQDQDIREGTAQSADERIQRQIEQQDNAIAQLLPEKSETEKEQEEREPISRDDSISGTQPTGEQAATEFEGDSWEELNRRRNQSTQRVDNFFDQMLERDRPEPATQEDITSEEEPVAPVAAPQITGEVLEEPVEAVAANEIAMPTTEAVSNSNELEAVSEAPDLPAVREDTDTEQLSTFLSGMTVKELRKLGKEAGIKIPSKAKKASIVDQVIQEAPALAMQRQHKSRAKEKKKETKKNSIDSRDTESQPALEVETEEENQEIEEEATENEQQQTRQNIRPNEVARQTIADQEAAQEIEEAPESWTRENRYETSPELEEALDEVAQDNANRPVEGFDEYDPNTDPAYRQSQDKYADSAVDAKTGELADSYDEDVSPDQQAEPREFPWRTTDREMIDNFDEHTAYQARKQAQRQNEARADLFRSLKKTDPDLTEEEFNRRYPINEEAFQNEAAPRSSQYTTINQYDNGQTATGGDGIEIPGVTVKDNRRKNRLIDRIRRMYKKGIFPVYGQSLTQDDFDKDRERHWSAEVENSINMLRDDFGMSGMNGTRNVFRLVMLYSSMSYDRNGKMFNQDANEWYMTEVEFINICRMIHVSAMKFGNPLIPPHLLGPAFSEHSELRGTDMYPSGVLPRSLAQAITGPNSCLVKKNEDGSIHEITTDEIIEDCKRVWNTITYPMMKLNLTNENTTKYNKRKKKNGEEVQERNLVAQRINIENMQEALADLDNVDVSKEYGIDNKDYYSLRELQDSQVTYAEATNGLYDSDEVERRWNERIEEEAERAAKMHNKRIGAVGSGATLLVGLEKANALFLNVPIAMSAVLEKGVASLQKHVADKTMQKFLGRHFDISQYKAEDELVEAFKSDPDAYIAINEAYLILEVTGSQAALAMFVREGNKLEKGSAEKWLREKYFPLPSNGGAAKVQEMDRKLTQISQRLLAGDMFFKSKDAFNFIEGFTTMSAVLAFNQQRMKDKTNKLSSAGIAFTGEEISNAWRANNKNMIALVTEMIGTVAGQESLKCMKAYNIANFNPIGWKVNDLFRKHGISNALITTFIDTFCSYGINFCYTMIPLSRTMTYIGASLVRHGTGKDRYMDFTLGGSLGGEPGSGAWAAGLAMNLTYDACTIGRWALIGGVLGIVLLALGFDPPDDEDNIDNVSMWKIGSNIGLGEDTDGDGKGNGIEIQMAWWMNDLTQFGLPLAYAIGALFNGQSMDTAVTLFNDCARDQFDGNITLDMIEAIENFGVDMFEIERIQKEGSEYVPDARRTPSLFLENLMLAGATKLTPGSTLYRNAGTSALLRGQDARMYSTNYVYDRSSQWAIDVGKQNFVEDPEERIARKYAAKNWLWAFMCNKFRNAEDDNATGYFWWDMPPRTLADQRAITLAKEFSLDDWPKDKPRDGKKWDKYVEKKVEYLAKEIAQYPTPDVAVANGFFIPNDLRFVASDYYFSQINDIKRELDEYSKAKNWDGYYAFKPEYEAKKEELENFIYTWLKSDDIPTWYEGYEQLLSDYDVTYHYADGTPATGLDKILHPADVESVWNLKGNHPTSLLPFTVVDQTSNELVQRGYNANTVPTWYDPELTDLEHIKQNEGKDRIPSGPDKGKILNDVLFSQALQTGEWQNPNAATIDRRAWVPKKNIYELSDSVRGINKQNCTGSVYGDNGKFVPYDNNNNNNNSSGKGTGNNPNSNLTTDRNGNDYTPGTWKYDPKTNDWIFYEDKNAKGNLNPNNNNNKNFNKSYYPRRSYSRGSRWNRSSSDYNPKIYNYSRSINTDRPTTMGNTKPYTATTTYLRPAFYTKGSRESYKRQDI